MENGTFSLKKSVNVKQCMRKVRVYYKYWNSKLTGTNQLSSWNSFWKIQSPKKPFTVLPCRNRWPMKSSTTVWMVRWRSLPPSLSQVILVHGCQDVTQSFRWRLVGVRNWWTKKSRSWCHNIWRHPIQSIYFENPSDYVSSLIFRSFKTHCWN